MQGEVDVGECAASTWAQVLFSFVIFLVILLILVLIRLVAMRRQLREEMLQRLDDKEAQVQEAQAAQNRGDHAESNQAAIVSADVTAPAEDRENGGRSEDETH